MIRKRNEFKNLARLEQIPEVIVDKSSNSEGYFGITFLPRRLYGGKNVLKLQGTRNLLKTTELQFEVLDAAGQPIFYEVLNYLASDGSRAIILYIYPDTTPGPATLYLASRAIRNADTGDILPISDDANDINFSKNPNVLWRNTIVVNPNEINTSEVIYLAPPKVTVKEIVQTFQVPDTRVTPRVAIASGSVNQNISLRSSDTKSPVSLDINNPSKLSASPSNVVKENQFNIDDANTFLIDPTLNASLTAAESGRVIRLDQPELLPRVTTNTSFFLPDMVGGSITVSKIDTASLVPKASTILGQLINGEFVLSNTFSTTIIDVINDKTAVVNSPFEFYYRNPNSPSDIYQKATSFYNAFNFTASFLQRVSASGQTESSQSYADITIANLEPAAGDVNKIQTFYKPYGTLGNFTDAGFTIIENTSLLINTSSLVADALLGQKELPTGEFINQSIINQYWKIESASLFPPGTLPTMRATSDKLSYGLTVTTGSIAFKDFDVNDINASAVYLQTTSSFQSTTDTTYKLTFRAASKTSPTFRTKQYPNPILDVYISGSIGVEVDKQATFNVKAGKRRRAYLGKKFLGTYLGSITEEGLFLKNEFTFKTLEVGNITPLFVIRSGEWTFADIDIITDKQSGFTPNSINFKTRIPSVFLNTEMMFKFKFFDAAGNPAPVESSVYGVQFKGNNVYLAGNNNLLTGSVYIGNTLNSGIEMSGKSSGYVMSVGYKGYTSASLGKGPGGFLMWSGSNKLNVGVDNYQGVGLELIGENDEAHLIFDSFKNTFDVKAKSFFVGDSGSQFISGSNGQIEISSSNFHLTPNGDLFAQGIINANSGYFKNINVVGQPITIATALTTNDFIYTTSSVNYVRNKFISIGVSPVNTGSNINNNIIATASINTSASISYTVLFDAYRDFILSSSILYYPSTKFEDPDDYALIVENPPSGLTIDTGSTRNYYPRIGSYGGGITVARGTVTASFTSGDGAKVFNLFEFDQLTWTLMWANANALGTMYKEPLDAQVGQDGVSVDYLITGSNQYTGLNTPMLRSAIIRARRYDPVELRYKDFPFFVDPTQTRDVNNLSDGLLASSSITNINFIQSDRPGENTFTVETNLIYDGTFAFKEPLFLDIQSIVTGSAVNNSDIIGKRYTLGNINWTIGGPLYTGSLGGTYTSDLAYYKNYTDIPDYNLPLQEFVRWNEKTNAFEEYSFTSSMNIGGVNIAPYSGFLFLSSSNAVVSSSQFTYGVNASNTSSADSVVFFNRREYTPGAYGLRFTGTNYGTSSYGTRIIGTANNVVSASGTIDVNYLASSSTWDYIETDFIDISNYVQASSLIAEAIKLQFAMRWSDNFSNTANIIAQGQVSSSGTLLPETTYNRYGGFLTGLQTYITVTFYDGDYKTTAPDPRELPLLGTKIVASDSNGSTNKWYVGDFFINPFIQRNDGTIPNRIKIRITWGAHPSVTLNPAKFATYYTAGPSTGSFFFTGYPASGRYNGIVMSEIRLMQAAKAEVVDFTEVKIAGTSISTIVTGSVDYQEINAAGLIPGDYRLALDGTYNITLGTSWKPWTSLYSENIYRTNEYSLSDREAKTSITATDLGLSFINKLEPVSYKWKKSDDDIKHYGLIAQDVASVLSGTGISIDGKTISYTELISPMIKAIQELSTKLKQLELEVSSSKH